MLHLAGTYLRDVAASIARIRENVLDWEHLPALHASSFAACELVDEDADGWRIRLTGKGGGPAQILKLVIAPDTSRYCVTTEAGPGAGSEIRVAVTPTGANACHVRVEYHIPEADPAMLAMIGKGFVAIYERLWDEDEAMMQAREAALAPRPRAPDTVDLGIAAALSLPLDFDLGNGRFRLIRHQGALLAHSRICPHWLGPLETPPDADGCLACPWHGLRFDATTGRSADGRALRLAPAPTIRIEAGRVLACALALFTRWPEAGKAKTRLIPALGPKGAADLHRRLTERTVATVRSAGLALEIRSTGADPALFRDWLGVDDVVDQGEGDLGERLARTAASLPVLLLGADIPGLIPQHLTAAAAALATAPAVIGPAADGGYWLLGLAESMPQLFTGIEWGTDSVLAATLARLPPETPRLETLSDLDTPEDLAHWPDL